MPRAIWSGSISFGLVEIPVELIPAEESSKEIKFTYLDRRDLSPVGYERVSKATGKVVPWEDVVRGYEYEEDEYVVLNEQDFKKANPKATKTIDIVAFVDASEIEPIYYEKPYYLEPAKKTSKGYALLRETLKRKNKVGIAKVVIRTKEHLAAVTVRGNILLLEILRFAYELRDPKDLRAPEERSTKAMVSRKEIEMAEQIVEGMTTTWDPEEYKDEYRNDLMALIRQKVKSGQSKTIEEPEKQRRERQAEVVDLMPLLKQSIEKTRSASSKSTARSAKGSVRGRKKRSA